MKENCDCVPSCDVLWTCTICGKDEIHRYAGQEWNRMQRDNLCFHCAFWELRAEAGCPTVIDGCTYTPGTRTTGEWRGMGGRKFDIEYFDGRVITTYDLWCGGVIPERWRERLPNTARFINGAERVDNAYGGSAWVGSR